MQRFYELSRDETPRTQAWYIDNNQYLAHFHSTIELVYVEDGALYVMQDGASALVPKGNLIVNSSYMLHSYSTPQRSRIIVVTIPLSTVPTLRTLLAQNSFAKGVVDVRRMPECRRILQMMTSPENRANVRFINSLGEALLALLIDKVGLKETTSESDLLKKILIYLQEHAAEPLTVGEAAAHFGYSVGRFSHIFNERIGCSFTRYLNSLRCGMARRMLAEGTSSLIDVATACGFSSLRTFHRVYKAYAGQTPRAEASGKGGGAPK